MSTVADQRLALCAIGNGEEGLAETLVHGLAQMPSDTRLETPAKSGVETVIRGYGLDERVDWGSADKPGRLHRGGRIIEVARGTDALHSATLGELVDLVADGDVSPVASGSDEAFNGQRIAIVTNLPAPYRMPLFERMSARVDAAGGHLKVFFASGEAADRPWIEAQSRPFDHEIGAGIKVPIRRRRPPVFSPDLYRRLRHYRPTIVLAGSLSPLVAGRALAYARRNEVPFGIWSGETRAVAPRSRLRMRYRRHLLGNSDFLIAYGSEALSYARSLTGCPMVVGRNTSQAGSGDGEAGDATATRLVTVGDLDGPRKGIDIAIDALLQAPELSCTLTIAGGGSSQPELERRAAGDDRIRFLGWVPHAEIAGILADADVFLFPTRSDVFGLALVEAMAAGLACVTTRAPGVAADLAVDGSTCVIAPDHRPSSWASAIEGLVRGDGRISALAERASRTVAGRWTLDHAADSMLAGLRLGIASSR